MEITWNHYYETKAKKKELHIKAMKSKSIKDWTEYHNYKEKCLKLLTELKMEGK